MNPRKPSSERIARAADRELLPGVITSDEGRIIVSCYAPGPKQHHEECAVEHEPGTPCRRKSEGVSA